MTDKNGIWDMSVSTEKEEAQPAKEGSVPEEKEEPVPEVKEEAQPAKNDVSVPEEMRQISGTGGTITDALKAMLSFFTIIRLDVGQREFDAMERNFWLCPLLGFLNGLVALVVALIMFESGLDPFITAVAAIASMYIFSKFLHLDGLTDFGDGMVVSSGKREDHVRALKDTLIGAGGFGVALTVILLSVAGYTTIGSAIGFVGFFALIFEVLVKNAQVFAAAFGEPGNGMAARQVGCTTKRSAAKSLVLSAVLVAVALGIYYLGRNRYLFYGVGFSDVVVVAVLAFVVSIIVGLLMARNANRTFGFVNGDILGATNEVSRAAMAVVSAVAAGLIL